MKRVAIVLAIAVLGCWLPAIAQDKTPPKNFAEVVDHMFTGVEKEFVPAVEAIPDDKVDFAPSASMGEFKGVRTFGQQAKHVAAVNYILGAAILGEKPPVDIKGENGPDELKSKAEIAKYVKDSFAYAHKAIKSLNDQNTYGTVKSPFGGDQVTRATLALYFIGHEFDHYGQMVEYLRMNGVIPPASRAQ